uniref:Uncharacterized protein n=1 Tax=Ditylenchus dipsaci TaxID=166011 RepID=A0A915DJZ3_9BILA
MKLLFSAILVFICVSGVLSEVSGLRFKRQYYGNCCNNGPPGQQVTIVEYGRPGMTSVSTTQQQGGLLGAILGAPVTTITQSGFR